MNSEDSSEEDERMSPTDEFLKRLFKENKLYRI